MCETEQQQIKNNVRLIERTNTNTNIFVLPYTVIESNE